MWCFEDGIEWRTSINETHPNARPCRFSSMGLSVFDINLQHDILCSVNSRSHHKFSDLSFEGVLWSIPPSIVIVGHIPASAPRRSNNEGPFPSHPPQYFFFIFVSVSSFRSLRFSSSFISGGSMDDWIGRHCTCQMRNAMKFRRSEDRYDSGLRMLFQSCFRRST